MPPTAPQERPVVAEEAAPTAAAPPPAAAPGAVGEISLQKVRSLWQNVRTRVEGEKPSMSGPLSSTMVEKYEGDTLTLRASSPPNAQLLRAQQALVQKALADVLGRPVTLVVLQGPGAPPPTEDDGGADDLMRYSLKRLG